MPFFFSTTLSISIPLRLPNFMQSLFQQTSSTDTDTDMDTAISQLPEGCLSHVLSLTSPVDVIRSSIVSKQFYSAAESDAIWSKFLPSDCDHIISFHQTSSTCSKKDLFFNLCQNPVLFDDSTKSFALDKWSGNKCYMLGARALSIIWGDTPEYWTWDSEPESRFPECATLQDVCWLEIKGQMHTQMLSSGTTYGVYFVFKMKPVRFSGFVDVPVSVCVIEVGEDGLLPKQHDSVTYKSYYLKGPESAHSNMRHRQRRVVNRPTKREDGWLEIEMGSYHVGASNGANERVVLEFILKETEMLNWKKGLLVQGIEVRPLR